MKKKRKKDYLELILLIFISVFMTQEKIITYVIKYLDEKFYIVRKFSRILIH